MDNTTYLITHIQKHHAKEHAEFLKLNKTKGAGDSTAQQQTSSLKALAITQKVLEFIASDAQPVSVVEGEGFRRLLEYFEPRYSLP